MQSIVEVIQEAADISLISVHDAKIGLNTVSTTGDEQIELFIKWASAEVARMCNRVFAQETVIETVMELEGARVYLSHWPIKTITEVSEAGIVLVAGTDYFVDKKEGVLHRSGGAFWGLPTVIQYTGGYDLPQKAPPELSSAVILVAREGITAAKKGDSTIRMITHKQSRIMYFDPNAAAAKAASSASSAGTASRRAISDLIRHHQRFVV